ncbi:hypothetical protein JCM17845_29320 [Iodidimonas gelatinilytica]|uniref:Uncharacterized protein n=1 Tax=Iodidimonas gelatinilytica TaxID=1236966 RepID=A0A5A7N5G2_9PROT|nr:hypothetical protein JCM17845_29320 [Iodidimonas gelatinilytica]
MAKTGAAPAALASEQFLNTRLFDEIAAALGVVSVFFGEVSLEVRDALWQ